MTALVAPIKSRGSLVGRSRLPVLLFHIVTIAPLANNQGHALLLQQGCIGDQTSLLDARLYQGLKLLFRLQLGMIHLWQVSHDMFLVAFVANHPFVQRLRHLAIITFALWLARNLGHLALGHISPYIFVCQAKDQHEKRQCIKHFF